MRYMAASLPLAIPASSRDPSSRESSASRRARNHGCRVKPGMTMTSDALKSLTPEGKCVARPLPPVFLRAQEHAAVSAAPITLRTCVRRSKAPRIT